jgi:Co/Zn/Cd efflux system component
MTDVHPVGEAHHHHGEQGHDHDHDHDHHHHAGESRNPLIWIAEALHLPGFGHSHDHGPGDVRVMENELGILTLKRALLALGITTVLQVVIYVASGSVALLADTVHNFGDALNSIPLWLAFLLARRAATKRFTYGYGRAEEMWRGCSSWRRLLSAPGTSCGSRSIS